MKVALLLKGSSINSYHHWQYKDRISIDYKHSLENFKANIIDNNNCDVFFHTWKSQDVDIDRYEEIAKDYNAVSYIIDDDINGDYGPNLGKKVITTTKRVIQCYKEYITKYNKVYDLVIICRFDLFFFHKIDLRKILDLNILGNTIFVYALESNINNSVINKSTTKEQGIDDNFVVFTPDVINEYDVALDLKTETIATTRSPEFFNPKQHCSLHHLYFLLDDKIVIKNLVDVFTHIDRQSLYGTTKGLEQDSSLIRKCDKQKYLKIHENLFVIHYS